MKTATKTLSKTFDATSAGILYAVRTGIFVTSYGGRVGCMCGCKGSYSDAPGTIKRRVTDMLRLASEGNKIEPFGFDKNLGCGYSVDYVTDAGYEKRIALYVRQ